MQHGADRLAAGRFPAWQTHQSKRVAIHAVAGSYAARRAPTLCAQAEQIIVALEKLLEPAQQHREQRVDIYMIELPTDDLPTSTSVPIQGGQHPAGEDNRAAAIAYIVRPEAPSEPIAQPLTRLLVPRWFGQSSAAAVRFLDGIAGVVASRTAAGAPLQEAHDWVLAELAARRPISIAVQAASSTSASITSESDRAATSFVAFLLEAFGPQALQHFLREYDPNRPDQAAMAAYQRPIGVLEEFWLTKLQRPATRSRPFRTFIRQLVPLLKPYWRRELEILLYMLIGLSYGIGLPLSGKYLIDTIIPSGDLGQLLIFILALVAIYLLNAIIGVRRAYVNAEVNQRILIDLQERMFAHLQRLPHRFYATAKIGDLMSRLSNDLQIVQQALSQVAGVGVFMALNAIAAAMTLILLSPMLGGLVLVVVPLFAVSYHLLSTRLQQASYKRQQLAGEATTAVQENLAAHAVVKAFGLEGRAIATYHSRLMDLLKAALRLTVIGALFETSISLAIGVGQIVVLGVGGYLVIAGELTTGMLLAFIGLLGSLFMPIAALAGVGQTVQMASGALDRVMELLDEPLTIADAPGATALSPLTHEIRLDQVTFSYDGARPILRDLSLSIPAGANVAIVGPSGSGKSTLVNLLMRFWEPDQGAVLFDGRDIRDATITSLRGQIGLVFQDTFIFDTTVRENIALGRPDASDAEIRAAARAAQLDDYIDALPSGYDTVLGEHGVRMSGGQRQRLAIARALVRDPCILILDEATSALDAQTEREIAETLAAVARGRTTISITHRLALAATADCIFVLEQGHLVEQGSHAALIAAGGLYQRLYEEQTGALSSGSTGRNRVERDRLKTIPLLGGLDDEALTVLAERLVPERYPAHVEIARQGEPGDKLYLIDRGQVEIVITDGQAEQRINTLDEGDYFGELALLGNQPRAATVRTTMPTQLYRLSRSDFLELLEHEPTVRQTVAQIVADRRAALAMITSMAPRIAQLEYSTS